MKRKVNRVGTNTLTVSLPSKWAQEQRIQAGDEVEVSAEKGSITIARTGAVRPHKEITVNVDEFDHLTLVRYFDVLYRDGYDHITFLHDHDEIYYEKKRKNVDVRKAVRKMIERTVGSEIISQTQKRTEIECLVSAGDQDLQRIEKRIFYLFKEMLEQILSSAKKGEDAFSDDVYAMHDNITKFTNYLLRELEASDLPLVEKQLTYALYMVVDKLVDKARHIAEKIILFGRTKKLDAYLSRIVAVLEKHFLALHRGSFPRQVIEERYVLVEEIRKEKFSNEELQVIMEANLFLDVMNEFIQLSIAKGLPKG